MVKVKIGPKVHTAFGEETTWGTKASTTNSWIGLVQSFEPEESNNFNKYPAHGFGRNYAGQVAMNFDVSGSIEYYPQDFLFWKYAFGQRFQGLKYDGTASNDDNQVVSIQAEDYYCGKHEEPHTIFQIYTPEE